MRWGPLPSAGENSGGHGTPVGTGTHGVGVHADSRDGLLAQSRPGDEASVRKTGSAGDFPRELEKRVGEDSPPDERSCRTIHPAGRRAAQGVGGARASHKPRKRGIASGGESGGVVAGARPAAESLNSSTY